MTKIVDLSSGRVSVKIVTPKYKKVPAIYINEVEWPAATFTVDWGIDELKFRDTIRHSHNGQIYVTVPTGHPGIDIKFRVTDYQFTEEA